MLKKSEDGKEEPDHPIPEADNTSSMQVRLCGDTELSKHARSETGIRNSRWDNPYAANTKSGRAEVCSSVDRPAWMRFNGDSNSPGQLMPYTNNAGLVRV